jgi:hypothetical protein
MAQNPGAVQKGMARVGVACASLSAAKTNYHSEINLMGTASKRLFLQPCFIERHAFETGCLKADAYSGSERPEY